jgi:signal transduction histidine kinase
VTDHDLAAQLKETRARLDEAEAARRRAELLAKASAVLADSLDYKVVLDRVAQLVVGEFSDWCVIDVIEDGEIHRVAGAHVDPAKQPLMDELRRRFPPHWDSPQPAVRALKTGTPQVFAQLTEEQIIAMSQTGENARLVLEMGARSGLTVPLIAGGHVVGAFTAGSGRPDRRFDQPEDMQLVLEIARRAAVAIDHAQSHQKLQEAVRLRDEFLSVASHELNTPMAALMLSLEGLGTPDPDLKLDVDGMVQVAKLAERQGKRLTKLITDLLDVTRLSRGALPLQYEECDLAQLVREVVARYKPELERAGCELTLILEGPAIGEWDPMRLDQVVLNLLANAAKFGARKPIEVKVEKAADQVRLTVTDHGIGVDPGQHERIFERFERGVLSHSYGGLGLGLYICRRIVQSHHGSIRVDSEPGHGSTFTVELPVRRPAGS